MTVTTPQEDITTILERETDDPRDKCHKWRGKSKWSLCGGESADKGPDDAPPGRFHTTRECRERGHKHCVACTELGRQLGQDDVVVA
jgi:hypothetical protein